MHCAVGLKMVKKLVLPRLSEKKEKFIVVVRSFFVRSWAILAQVLKFDVPATWATASPN